jgi:hypothetical protein
MTHGPEWKVETNCMRLIIADGALITCLPALTARAASELSRDQIVVAMAVDTAIFAAEKCPRFRYACII